MMCWGVVVVVVRRWQSRFDPENLFVPGQAQNSLGKRGDSAVLGIF